MLQKNPNLPQEEIAKKIKLSQPSVGARIKKLQQKGVLNTVNGVNFKVAELSLAKIDVSTTDTTAIIAEFKNCHFFLNALVTSGKYNLCCFLQQRTLGALKES
jgi:DNA-binding Lrp family transcriptional regulator